MEKHKTKKPHHNLFIHTPKCSGTYVKNLLRRSPVILKNHLGASCEDKQKYITFTVFRDPVDRFESMLNFRLTQCFHNNEKQNIIKIPVMQLI